LRAWLILLILAFIWATLAAVLMALLSAEEDVLAPQWLPVLGIPLLPLFALVGYTCAFFRCVLASGKEGKAGQIRWPGAADITQVLWSLAACLLSFLATPVVPVAVAILFWLYSGDLTWVDRLILWELGLVAVGCWALALLAVDQSGRLRDVNPVALARMTGRLGWRGWLLVGLATAGVLFCFHFTLGALEDLHDVSLAWLALFWWGFCGTAWIVFLLRWFGVSQFRARQRRKDEGKAYLAHESRSPAHCLPGPGS
jgi:hypothetical protein